jgi:hypothetical protein
MKTTIQINGLDVEFTDEAPTRAGAYWFKCSTTYPPELVHVTEHSDSELWAVSINLDHSLEDLRGNLWSAPLVPVTEVNWNPIETAPRDGSKILTWCKEWGCEILFWTQSVWVSKGGAWIACEMRSDTVECHPTHWQELPEGRR